MRSIKENKCMNLTNNSNLWKVIESFKFKLISIYLVINTEKKWPRFILLHKSKYVADESLERKIESSKDIVNVIKKKIVLMKTNTVNEKWGYLILWKKILISVLILFQAILGKKPLGTWEGHAVLKLNFVFLW